MYKLINDELIISNLEEELKGKLPKQKNIEEEVIEEGIKYFKTSEKLEKVAQRLNHNSQIIKDEEQKSKVIKAASQLQALSISFKKLEYEYQYGNKNKAKSDYKELLKKYKDIATMLKKEDMKKALKRTNSLVVTIASMAVSYCMITNIGNIILKSATSDGNDIGSLFSSVAKIGASYIARLPVYAIGGINSKKIDKINNDGEVIRYVQKTFPAEFR